MTEKGRKMRTTNRQEDRTRITGVLLVAAAMLAMVVGACTTESEPTTTTVDELTTTTTEPDLVTSTTSERSTTTTNSGNSETTQPTGGSATVIMRQTSFVEDQIIVSVGTAVTWTNEDTIPHTSTSNNDLWDSGNMSPGDSFEFVFDEPGTYDYFCSIHPSSMRGTVVVEG